MADYYTKLCIKFPAKTQEERLWWMRADLIILQAVFDEDATNEVAAEFFKLYPYLWEQYAGETICDIELDELEDAIYITDYAGHANIDGIGHLIQAYLKDFGLEEPVAFSWAEVCTSHRSDGFGGGVCFVTKDEVKIQSTFGLIEDWVTSLKIPTTANLYDTTPYGIGRVEE